VSAATGFHRVGTYRGDATAFFLPYADRLITVEVDDDLFRRVRARFAREPKITVVEGGAIVEIPPDRRGGGGRAGDDLARRPRRRP
jgi:hypothetical protein